MKRVVLMIAAGRSPPDATARLSLPRDSAPTAARTEVVLSAAGAEGGTD